MPQALHIFSFSMPTLVSALLPVTFFQTCLHTIISVTLFPSLSHYFSTPFQHVHSNYVHEDMNDTLSLGYLSMLQYISLSLSAGVDVSWLNGGHHLLQGRTH